MMGATQAHDETNAFCHGREHASVVLAEEDMSPDLVDKKDEEHGPGVQTRPPTVEERIMDLYNTSTSAKPMPMNL